MRLHEEALKSVLKGVRMVAEAALPTLGPNKQHVMIQDLKHLILTQDSALITRHLALPDRFENMGAQLVKEAASKTHEQVGDGRVTAIVLANTIYTEGVQAVIQGACPLGVRKGIEKAVSEVCRFLDETAVIGELAQTLELEGGLLSPYFITAPETMTAEFQNLHIAVVEKALTCVRDIAPLLEKRKKGPLLIIARRAGKEAIATLAINRVKSHDALCLVKTPSDLQKIAAWVGAKIVKEKFSISMLGKTTHALITREKTILTGRKSARICAGGGTVLLRAAASLQCLSLAGDELIGAKAVCKACFTPTILIANNCGESGPLVAEKVYARKKNWGHNAVTGKYVDLLKAGIVDSVEVLQTALRNGAAVAVSLLNVGALVVK